MYVCARPQKDTGRFGARIFLHLEYRTIHMQEDKRVYRGFINVSLRRLLAEALLSFGTREI